MRRLAAAFRDLASSPAAVALTPSCRTHAWLLRADRALHALLGMKRFPTNDTMRNLFKRFTPGRVVRFYEPLWAWVTARVAHTLIFMYAPLPHARQTARSRSGLFTARDRALREEVNSPLQHQIDPLPLFEFLSSGMGSLFPQFPSMRRVTCRKSLRGTGLLYQGQSESWAASGPFSSQLASTSPSVA